MRVCKAATILLIALLVFTGCSDETPHSPGVCECEQHIETLSIIQSPYFNLPTIDDRYSVQVRHFARCWDGYLVGSGRRFYNTDGRGRDFYTCEWEWLQEYPEHLTRRRSDICPVHMAQRVINVRVVTSVAELEPGMEEYTDCFFYSKYLVVVDFCVSSTTDVEMVYRAEENGTIIFRPLLSRRNVHMYHPHPYGTVAIELDNRFWPQEFNVEFINNPWGPSCLSAIFNVPIFPGAGYSGYIFALICGAVVHEPYGAGIQRLPFAPLESNVFTAATIQNIIDFIAPEYIRYIEPNYIIYLDPMPCCCDTPTPTPVPTLYE